MTLKEVYAQVYKSLTDCRLRMSQISNSNPAHAPVRYPQEMEHERDLLTRLERLARDMPVEPQVQEQAQDQEARQGPSNWERLRPAAIQRQQDNEG